MIKNNARILPIGILKECRTAYGIVLYFRTWRAASTRNKMGKLRSPDLQSIRDFGGRPALMNKGRRSHNAWLEYLWDTSLRILFNDAGATTPVKRYDKSSVYRSCLQFS